VLTQAIVEDKLSRGSLHSVQSLALKLGVSRTPVREALIQLALQGMVKFERNRGVRILETSARDSQEIFEIRAWLEVPATRRAGQLAGPKEKLRIRKEFDAMLKAAQQGHETAMWRYDRAFHFEILSCSGNLRLANYVDELRNLILTRGITTANQPRSLVEIAEEHRPILGAIERGDGVRAAEEMAKHIQHTNELLRGRSLPDRAVQEPGGQ
jgi:DNA-binding GntR family transcriptional regulator